MEELPNVVASNDYAEAVVPEEEPEELDMRCYEANAPSQASGVVSMRRSVGDAWALDNRIGDDSALHHAAEHSWAGEVRHRPDASIGGLTSKRRVPSSNRLISSNVSFSDSRKANEATNNTTRRRQNKALSNAASTSAVRLLQTIAGFREHRQEGELNQGLPQRRQDTSQASLMVVQKRNSAIRVETDGAEDLAVAPTIARTRSVDESTPVAVSNHNSSSSKNNQRPEGGGTSSSSNADLMPSTIPFFEDYYLGTSSSGFQILSSSEGSRASTSDASGDHFFLVDDDVEFGKGMSRQRSLNDEFFGSLRPQWLASTLTMHYRSTVLEDEYLLYFHRHRSQIYVTTAYGFLAIVMETIRLGPTMNAMPLAALCSVAGLFGFSALLVGSIILDKQLQSHDKMAMHMTREALRYNAVRQERLLLLLMICFGCFLMISFLSMLECPWVSGAIGKVLFCQSSFAWDSFYLVVFATPSALLPVRFTTALIGLTINLLAMFVGAFLSLGDALYTANDHSLGSTSQPTRQDDVLFSDINLMALKVGTYATFTVLGGAACRMREKVARKQFEHFALLVRFRKEATALHEALAKQIAGTMPPRVARRLLLGLPVKDVIHHSAIFAFGIPNFSSWSSHHSSSEVVESLNQLFCTLDNELAEHPYVTKMQTLGDLYIVVSGLDRMLRRKVRNPATMSAVTAAAPPSGASLSDTQNSDSRGSLRVRERATKTSGVSVTADSIQVSEEHANAKLLLAYAISARDSLTALLEENKLQKQLDRAATRSNYFEASAGDTVEAQPLDVAQDHFMIALDVGYVVCSVLGSTTAYVAVGPGVTSVTRLLRSGEGVLVTSSRDRSSRGKLVSANNGIRVSEAFLHHLTGAVNNITHCDDTVTPRSTALPAEGRRQKHVDQIELDRELNRDFDDNDGGIEGEGQLSNAIIGDPHLTAEEQRDLHEQWREQLMRSQPPPDGSSSQRDAVEKNEFGTNPLFTSNLDNHNDSNSKHSAGSNSRELCSSGERDGTNRNASQSHEDLVLKGSGSSRGLGGRAFAVPITSGKKLPEEEMEGGAGLPLTPDAINSPRPSDSSTDGTSDSQRLVSHYRGKQLKTNSILLVLSEFACNETEKKFQQSFRKRHPLSNKKERLCFGLLVVNSVLALVVMAISRYPPFSSDVTTTPSACLVGSIAVGLIALGCEGLVSMCFAAKEWLGSCDGCFVTAATGVTSRRHSVVPPSVLSGRKSSSTLLHPPGSSVYQQREVDKQFFLWLTETIRKICFYYYLVLFHIAMFTMPFPSYAVNNIIIWNLVLNYASTNEKERLSMPLLHSLLDFVRISIPLFACNLRNLLGAVHHVPFDCHQFNCLTKSSRIAAFVDEYAAAEKGMLDGPDMISIAVQSAYLNLIVVPSVNIVVRILHDRFLRESFANSFSFEMATQRLVREKKDMEMYVRSVIPQFVIDRFQMFAQKHQQLLDLKSHVDPWLGAWFATSVEEMSTMVIQMPFNRSSSPLPPAMGAGAASSRSNEKHHQFCSQSCESSAPDDDDGGEPLGVYEALRNSHRIIDALLSTASSRKGGIQPLSVCKAKSVGDLVILIGSEKDDEAVRAVRLLECAAAITRAFEGERDGPKIVLNSGLAVGAVIGADRLTFELFGEVVSTSLELLNAMPARGMIATQRFVAVQGRCSDDLRLQTIATIAEAYPDNVSSKALRRTVETGRENDSSVLAFDQNSGSVCTAAPSTASTTQHVSYVERKTEAQLEGVGRGLIHIYGQQLWKVKGCGVVPLHAVYALPPPNVAL